MNTYRTNIYPVWIDKKKVTRNLFFAKNGRYINRKLSWREESENIDCSQKKWKWKKESWEKGRQKLVPTEEDEKSCHGHISCLQWIYFPTKHSSKSRATPQQQKNVSTLNLLPFFFAFLGFLKCLAETVFTCSGVICWNSFHSCVSMPAITIEIPDWIDFPQSRAGKGTLCLGMEITYSQVHIMWHVTCSPLL